MITSLDSAKRFIGISGTADDARLNWLVQYADTAIKEFIGRDIESASYTEYYSGTGTRFLPLRQRPITAVANVWVDSTGRFGDNPDGSFAAVTVLVFGTDYGFQRDEADGSGRSGILVRYGTVWPEVGYQDSARWITMQTGQLTRDGTQQTGNIKVSYTAGYAMGCPPRDLEMAANMWISAARRSAPYGAAMDEEHMGQYGYKLAMHQVGIGPEVGTIRQILSRYREVVF